MRDHLPLARDRCHVVVIYAIGGAAATFATLLASLHVQIYRPIFAAGPQITPDLGTMLASIQSGSTRAMDAQCRRNQWERRMNSRWRAFLLLVTLSTAAAAPASVQTPAAAVTPTDIGIPTAGSIRTAMKQSFALGHQP
jgi:hypothetical protein